MVNMEADRRRVSPDKITPKVTGFLGGKQADADLGSEG